MSSLGTTGYTVLNEDADMYSVIRPAEVCSIETAKSLGIFDKTHYYKGESRKNVRTFSPATQRDAQRPFSFCKESAPGALGEDEAARPMCSLIAPGLIPKRGNTCGRPDGECPPGFTYDNRTKSCKKPIRAVKQKREQHCSKQWHDWFTIPNFGLKNGYEMVNGQCLEPCPENTLPIRGKDPITNEVRGSDSIKQCVDKIEYIGGKYQGEPDFCNLSWIKRLSVKMPSLGEEHVSKYPLFAVSGSQALEQAANEGVNDILKETLRSPENLAPHPEITDGVCAKNVDTPERLQEAYAICKNIQQNTSQAQSKYIEDMSRTLKMVNNNINPQQLRTDILNRFQVLKQACHYTFCDDAVSQSERAKLIGKEPICLPKSEIQRAALSSRDPLTSQLSSVPGDYPDQYTESAPSAQDRKVVQTFTKRIVNALLYLLTYLCIFMGVYYIIDGILDFKSFPGTQGYAAEIYAATKMKMATDQKSVNAVVNAAKK